MPSRHHNPERHAWRGRSYKKGGKSVRALREVEAKPHGVTAQAWDHVSTGYYARKDGKGRVNLVGPRDWSAIIVEGGRISPAGNGHSALVAMSFVDRAVPPCSNCLGTSQVCGYHGVDPGCSCGGLDCPDCTHR